MIGDSGTRTVVNGVLAYDGTAIDTSGTGEDDLQTITIPQYYYNRYNGLRFYAAGIKSNGGTPGNKTLKLYWASNAYTFNAAANDSNDWRIEGTILFQAAAQQNISWLGWNGATPLQGYEQATDDLSAGDLILKITGECADAGDVISQRLWIIEVF